MNIYRFGSGLSPEFSHMNSAAGYSLLRCSQWHRDLRSVQARGGTAGRGRMSRDQRFLFKAHWHSLSVSSICMAPFCHPKIFVLFFFSACLKEAIYIDDGLSWTQVLIFLLLSPAVVYLTVHMQIWSVFLYFHFILTFQMVRIGNF